MSLRTLCFIVAVALCASCNFDRDSTRSAEPGRPTAARDSTDAPASVDPGATTSPRVTAHAGLIDGRFITDGNVVSANGDRDGGVLRVRIQKATADRDLAVCSSGDTFEMSYDDDTIFVPKRIRSNDRFPSNLSGLRVTITGTVERAATSSGCEISADRVQVGT